MTLTMRSILLLCICLEIPGSWGSRSAEISPHSLLRRQGVLATECHLKVPTSLWTTCQQMLDKYSLNIDSFFAMNPAVRVDCAGFSPGTSYCVRTGL